MLVETKNVSTTLPAALVAKLDRRLSKKLTPRAEWLRLAILKVAQDEGLIRVTVDHTGEVYDLDMLDGVAA